MRMLRATENRYDAKLCQELMPDPYFFLFNDSHCATVKEAVRDLRRI
jgi:hypothetical protein